MGFGRIFKTIGQAIATGAAVSVIPAIQDPGHFHPLQGGSWVGLAPLAASGAILGLLNQLTKSPDQYQDASALDALVGRYQIVTAPTTGGTAWQASCPTFALAAVDEDRERAVETVRAAARNIVRTMLLNGMDLPPATVPSPPVMPLPKGE